MKKFLIFGLASLFFLFQSCGGSAESEDENTDSLSAQKPVEPNAEGLYEAADIGEYLLYGWTKIDDKGEIASVSDLTSSVGSGKNFEGKVEVEIAEVCQKAGCWIVFYDAYGSPIRTYFRDHFTIPIETAIGTNVILYGSTQQDTTSIALQQHLLQDAKDAGEEVSQAEIDAIVTDKIETTFDCEAILVSKVK